MTEGTNGSVEAVCKNFLRAALDCYAYRNLNEQ